jgi:hypothetical protein
MEINGNRWELIVGLTMLLTGTTQSNAAIGLHCWPNRGRFAQHEPTQRMNQVIGTPLLRPGHPRLEVALAQHGGLV